MFFLVYVKVGSKLKKASMYVLFIPILVSLLFSPISAQEAGTSVCDVTGIWSATWGEMYLFQSGSGVTGNYTWDDGRLEGSLSGSTFTGRWTEAPSYSEPRDAGDVEFTFSKDCTSFSGKWRYGSNGTWSEDWSGTKLQGEEEFDRIEEIFEEEEFFHPCLEELSELDKQIQESMGLPVGVTDEQIEKIKSMPGGVSIIDEIEGNVEVLREGEIKWSPAEEKTVLNPGDAIRTGSGGRVGLINKEIMLEGDEAYMPRDIQIREAIEQLELEKNREASEAGGLRLWWATAKFLVKNLIYGQPEIREYKPDYVWMSGKTDICIGNFFVKDLSRGEIDIKKGIIRILFPKYEQRTRSVFVVRTGTTVCGIRGSDVLIDYDPETEKVDAYVIEGHMDMTNIETGEMKSLTDNQKLVVENGNLGEIQTLSQNEWDTIIKEKGLDFVADETSPGTEVNVEKSGGIGRTTIIIILLILAVAIIILKKK
jgi:hypothetical protein